MKVKCDTCGKEFDRRPSAVKAVNYCSKECRHKATHITLVCDTCGVSFERFVCWGVSEHNFCCRECANVFTSQRMTAYNEIHNPTAMTDSRREALRYARLGKGSKDTYEKTFGRHTHRIVAEQMLGRPLKPGEVVHHIDGNKRNNNPENLMVFASQKEHTEWHAEHDKFWGR